MCLSPDEMSTPRIEAIIEDMRGFAADPNSLFGEIWLQRIKWFEGVLKERADDGTYLEEPP